MFAQAHKVSIKKTDNSKTAAFDLRRRAHQRHYRRVRLELARTVQ